MPRSVSAFTALACCASIFASSVWRFSSPAANCFSPISSSLNGTKPISSSVNVSGISLRNPACRCPNCYAVRCAFADRHFVNLAIHPFGLLHRRKLKSFILLRCRFWYHGCRCVGCRSYHSLSSGQCGAANVLHTHFCGVHSLSCLGSHFGSFSRILIHFQGFAEFIFSAFVICNRQWINLWSCCCGRKLEFPASNIMPRFSSCCIRGNPLRSFRCCRMRIEHRLLSRRFVGSRCLVVFVSSRCLQRL